MDDELEGFYRRGTTADYEDFLSFGGFSIELRGVVDLSLEDFLLGDVRHFGVAATADSSHNSIIAILGVSIDDPASMSILLDGGNPGIEFGPVL